MKKKLTVTTLAASMLFASIAGLPLSEKGLASKLGVTAGVASAATVQDQLNGLRTELARDTQGIADVRATRDYIKTNTDTPTFNSAKKIELLGNIWTKLNAKSPATIDLNPVFTLFNGLDLFYDESGATIDALINEPANRTVINDLFLNVGLPGINDPQGLTKQRVNDFQQAALAALQHADSKTALKISIAAAFLSDGSNSQVIKDAVNNIVTNKVLNQPVDKTNPDLLISNFLNLYGITLGDLNAFQNNVANEIARVNAPAGVKAIAARAALESAGVRYLLAGDIQPAPVSSTATYLQPGLKVFTQSINSYVTWTLQSETNVNLTNGVLSLNSGSTTGSGIIQARDNKFGLLLYISSPVTFTEETTTPVIGGGGGGGGGAQSDADKAISEITDLFKDIAGASAEKKEAILKEAQEKVNAAIEKLSTLNLASLVTVENGTAKPKLDVAGLVSKVKDIAAQAKLLNDKLTALNPNAKTNPVTLTLNFGTISAKSTEIPFPKDLLAAAVAAGVDKVAVGLNGLTLAVDPAEFGADTTLKVTSQDATVATSVTTLAVASGVYEFEFTSGGNKVESFNTPVEVSIPVPNGKNFDTELLTLAKIVDGKLEFYGGKFEGGVLNGVRNSFSTYTVVENKVSFGDTASVKAWAGRQIEVAAAKGILEGRADQAFEPNGLVTRAEFAKLIVKTFNLENASATESFSDVNDSDWFKSYVAAAVKSGIVNGKSDDEFDPNGQITRAEMAVMSSRALALKGASLEVSKIDDVLKGFKDVDAINSSLKNGVALAANEGIIVGEEGNLFNPNANSTRAQAAVVIYRLLNK
ncbi:S-layer homology domain-containing protein [Paenibacillus sp. Soil766]|uniref:S-layer homology domain-containing protein n=1 Tax=Paenibacillus sp. Soil766 TaxID=1736404 RepID=UPI00138F164F|nr:S-layer homology domain-containing protein [Paenibacillus sp. Soil766]